MVRKSFREIFRKPSLALLVLLLASTASFGRAQEKTASGPADPKELETFLDSFFAEELPKRRVPGAVFVLVKDGAVFFAKGYGQANLEKKIPIMPEKTLFRAGSVSKVFTATAVMQLVEQGKLKLDEDVNHYLRRFKLEENFPQPVTLAHLLTHTGGFDEHVIGMAVRAESEQVRLGEYLAMRMPPRLFPPGEIYSYSNHGMALAGYLVEVASGVPFERYVAENIFRPLGMSRSSFRLSAALVPDLATGYDDHDGNYRAVPFDYLNVPPAGGMVSTASDIARFMIAHLDQGAYGGRRILGPATVEVMHRQHFTHHPLLPGMTYGFHERFDNHQRALWHGGDIRGFGSLLFLLPEHRVGFFLAQNRDEFQLRADLVKALLDRYYPKPANSNASALRVASRSASERFAGAYRWNLYSRSSFEKLSAMLMEFRVAAGADGSLDLRPPWERNKPTRWMEVEPRVFESADGEGCAVFREGRNGRVTGLYLSMAGFQAALEKLAWYETTRFQVRLIRTLELVFLSACVGWPLALLVRRLRKRRADPPRVAVWARVVAGGISLLNTAFLAGLLLTPTQIDLYEFTYGVPRFFLALLIIPLVTTPLGVVVLAFSVLAWNNKYWSTLGRLHYSLVTLAAMAFIAFLNYWNLLGLHY